MRSNSERQHGDGAPLYQLKVTLKWSKPPIWRRLVVQGDMTLNCLHEVLQLALGWQDCHLHQFSTGAGFAPRTFYGPSDAGIDNRRGMRDERRYSVADLAPAVKRVFVYEYDFGDSWEHAVQVEKIQPPDPAFKHPVCLAGANACPPEDCGGIGGYYNLLKILADPKHPEHEDTMEWLGSKFAPEAFSVEEVNALLKRLEA